jgi:hypothetical protein
MIDIFNITFGCSWRWGSSSSSCSKKRARFFLATFQTHTMCKKTMVVKITTLSPLSDDWWETMQETMEFTLWWTNITMENHHFSWENPRFLWPFSIAFCMFTRGYHQTWGKKPKNIACVTSPMIRKVIGMALLADTVDGRNYAPVHRFFVPLFVDIYTVYIMYICT